jgi:transcriptional regulator with XRE-family HTH domain
MTNIREVFARNLKKYRQGRGFSQETLAEKTDSSKNYISLLENADNFPSSEMIQRLAAALGIDPTDLFAREGAPLATLKNCQKAALEDMYALLGQIVREKIADLG